MSKEIVPVEQFLIRGILATIESMAKLPFDNSNKADTQEVVIYTTPTPNTSIIPANQG